MRDIQQQEMDLLDHLLQIGKISDSDHAQMVDDLIEEFNEEADRRKEQLTGRSDRGIL